LRALGQMASGISHDFNNHLTGVLGFLEIVLDRPDLSDETRECLRLARDSSLAAADVVALLRNFYRKCPELAGEEVDLNELVEQTISLARPRWLDMRQQAGIDVKVEAQLGRIGPIEGHAAELQTALTNLLFNALDAVSHGGEITISTYVNDPDVVLEVRDNGTGMSQEVRDHCLDPFYTTKGVQGTGLGLSMVHGTVERHRGQMAIETQLGAGTTVRLCFPPAERRSATDAHAHDWVDERPKRVLCVDDDPRVLRFLESMLRNLGHTVKACSSGAAGRAALVEERFDVVLTDLGMPEVDGRQVAAAAKETSPGTYVILLTGWADRLAAEGDTPEGVDQVLGKPVTKLTLQAALSAASRLVVSV
jgi:CheY-like chemotaxis protein